MQAANSFYETLDQSALLGVSQYSILPYAIDHCYNLTTLSILIDTYANLSDLEALLVHSPSLRHCSVWENDTGSIVADSLLEVLSLHCPLLEKYFSNMMIESSDVLSTFLSEKCSNLLIFRFKVSMESYVMVESRGPVDCERYYASLKITGGEIVDISESVLKHYPRIQKISIENCNKSNQTNVNNIVKSRSHQLISLSIDSSLSNRSVKLRSLGNLVCLTSLSLHGFGDICKLAGMLPDKSNMKELDLC